MGTGFHRRIAQRARSIYMRQPYLQILFSGDSIDTDSPNKHFESFREFGFPQLQLESLGLRVSFRASEGNLVHRFDRKSSFWVRNPYKPILLWIKRNWDGEYSFCIHWSEQHVYPFSAPWSGWRVNKISRLECNLFVLLHSQLRSEVSNPRHPRISPHINRPPIS